MNDELDRPGSDPEMATPSELREVVADLKLAFLVPPDDLTTRRHLAALATAGWVQETWSLRSRTSRRRRRVLVPIGVAGGLILATGGLAAAEVLPAPMQRAVAAVAAPFGLDLPTGAPNSVDGGEPTPSGPELSGDPDADSPTPSAPAASGPSESAPGQGGTNPGRSDQAPGQGGTNPGGSDQAPGQQTEPGPSGSAPVHGGENPGTSGETQSPPSTRP